MVFSIVVHTTLFVWAHTPDFTWGLTSVYRRQGLKSRPRLAIFILIILNFVGATIYWVAWMADNVIKIRSVLVDNIGMELTQKMALSDAATAKLLLIELYLGPFTVL